MEEVSTALGRVEGREKSGGTSSTGEGELLAQLVSEVEQLDPFITASLPCVMCGSLCDRDKSDHRSHKGRRAKRSNGQQIECCTQASLDVCVPLPERQDILVQHNVNFVQKGKVE
jgi:hypothetical protein